MVATPPQRRLLVGQLREAVAGLAVGDCGCDQLGESGETLLGAVGGRFPRAGASGHEPPDGALDDDRDADPDINPPSLNAAPSGPGIVV